MSDRWRRWDVGDFGGATEDVARSLLGRYLIRRHAGGPRVLRIVETEAYLGAPDAASHARGGHRTPRVESLYLPAGHAYVYFVYGMHHCFNVVTDPEGAGGAVLIRAGAPVEGRERMWASRGRAGPPRPGELAGGPARLCQALEIDRALDGIFLADPDSPLRISDGEPVDPERIATGPRVGVAYAGEAAGWPLRFAVRGHPEVSRPKL